MTARKRDIQKYMEKLYVSAEELLSLRVSLASVKAVFALIILLAWRGGAPVGIAVQEFLI